MGARILSRGTTTTLLVVAGGKGPEASIGYEGVLGSRIRSRGRGRARLPAHGPRRVGATAAAGKGDVTPKMAGSRIWNREWSILPATTEAEERDFRGTAASEAKTTPQRLGEEYGEARVGRGAQGKETN